MLETYTQVYTPVPPKATNGKLWIEKKYLCMATAGLTDAKIRQIKHGVFSYRWDFKETLINVNSIGQRERDKFGIPNNERLLSLAKGFELNAALERYQGNDNGLDREINKVYEHLIYAKTHNWHNYYNLINDKYCLTKEKCRDFAQKWAVWQYITENYNRSKNIRTVFHAAYKLIFPEHLNEVDSFSNFKNACDLNGIESKVIDQRAVIKVQKMITSFQMALLQSLYIQPQKINAPAAHKKLIAACEGLSEKPYSLASVKNYFREFERNAELFAARYGATIAQKQLPFASLMAAEHRNTQWQIDGWTMPFWGANFQRYVLYLIRDNHSRKITGWSLAESENTTLILEGLEDAIRNTGVFPGELVADKHSFHKTKIAARLRMETELMGAIWTVTINAQRNQLAERYNQYLDAECKEFAGYLGKNVTATSKDARPAQEALTEYAKTANFKTFEEIKAIAAYAITQFNSKPLTALEGISPNEAYEKSEDKKCFMLSENERVALLRPMEPYQVNRGQIDIKVGMKIHMYQLPANLIDLYNNKKVAVVYEDLTQGIYISDLQSGEELAFIAPKQKIAGAIPDQSEADRKKMLQLKGRTTGVTVKARKAAQANILEALKENPEAIELINHYSLPKDIRALATQDALLRREINNQGINTDLMPIRAPKAASVALPAERGTKGKESPFAVVENEIEVMSMEEVF